MSLKKEPYLSEYCVDYWTWDKKDKYHRGFLKGNSLRTIPYMQKIVGVRGTRILNKGRYYWEINICYHLHWLSNCGTTMIGIGIKNCPLDDLKNLGEDDQSWLISDFGYLYHKGEVKRLKSYFLKEEYNTIGIFFDGIDGTLSFYENGEYLGVAFTNLHLVKEDLYPIVVTSKSNMVMSLKLAKREPLDLQDRCKAVILNNIKDEKYIKKLKLPKIMKQFLNGEEDRKRNREKKIIERQKFWRKKIKRKQI